MSGFWLVYLGYSCFIFFFFFSSRRRHTRFDCDWSSDCALPIFPASRGPVEGRDWYVNPQGQTFAVVRKPGPLPFVDRSNVDRSKHRTKILQVGRPYAIATTEVTRRSEERRVGKEGSGGWWRWE